MFPVILQIILLLIIIGGIIAYIGNYVGQLIGKKRLSLFNLRPRHTATAVTVLSGILITLTTLALLLIISRDVRTALLGLEELKVQLSTARTALIKQNLIVKEKLTQQKELEKKVSELLNTREKLEREIKTTREGQVLFKVGEVISLSLIQAGPESAKIEAGLKQILSEADSYIRTFGIKSDKRLINVPQEDFNQTLFNLMENNKIYIVRLVTTRNVLWGEDIPVRFELSENKLIYRQGEEIATLDLPPGLTLAEAEGEITGLLKLIHQNARAAGVTPDPGGSLGSLPYSQIYELAKKIRESVKSAVLKGLAGRNIYAIGPLEVKFKITYK